jgi:ADP-ribose pyrophosphatase
MAGSIDPSGSRWLLRRRLFSVEQVTYADASGKEFSRDVIRHPGSVVLLPVLADGRLCLIENYRVAVGERLVELPAGTLEPGEPPQECAARELQEETGYRAGRLDSITSFFPAPGILDERMHLFLARDLTPGPPAREPGEQIQNLELPLEIAIQRIQSGAIQDAKTIVGLLWYQWFTQKGV